MGILDKLLGKKQQAAEPRDNGVAKGLDAQSEEERNASRSRMEAEMEANRADREASKEG